MIDLVLPKRHGHKRNEGILIWNSSFCMNCGQRKEKVAVMNVYRRLR